MIHHSQAAASLSCSAQHKARKLVTGTTKRAHSHLGEETLRSDKLHQHRQQVTKKMRLAAGEKLCILVEFCHALLAGNEGWPNSDPDQMRRWPLFKAFRTQKMPPKSWMRAKKNAAVLSNHLTSSARCFLCSGPIKIYIEEGTGAGWP